MKNVIDIFLNDEETTTLHFNSYIMNSAKNSKNIFNLESNTKINHSLYETLYFDNHNDILNLFKESLIFSIRDLSNNKFYNLIFVFCIYFFKKKNIEFNFLNLNDMSLSNNNSDKWLNIANFYIKKNILNNCTYSEREKFIYSLKIKNINLLNIKNQVLTYTDIVKLSEFENWNVDEIKEYIIKISNTIENKLKEKGKFKEIQSNNVDYILSNDVIKGWRNISHKARHTTKETIKEWNSISKNDLVILFYVGISICIKILKNEN